MASKELIEKVARDLADLNDGTEETWEDFYIDARIAISTVLAALQEPTEGMLDAENHLQIPETRPRGTYRTCRGKAPSQGCEAVQVNAGGEVMGRYPTKQEIKDVMEDVEELDLPDGAYWAMVHDRLGLDYGDVFDAIAADPDFFDCGEAGGPNV